MVGETEEMVHVVEGLGGRRGRCEAWFECQSASGRLARPTAHFSWGLEFGAPPTRGHRGWGQVKSHLSHHFIGRSCGACLARGWTQSMRSMLQPVQTAGIASGRDLSKRNGRFTLMRAGEEPSTRSHDYASAKEVGRVGIGDFWLVVRRQ
ncbi:unnamed protein product [Protopolystoma xenopodis]|uniref:Uncharacterized protein n=1 Tax=Protopolystoma xenopodis TaxID=117903 RepID=A0A3S5AAR2_9PLAT|nr:unnamed protein product [Protopolystoma xenopodis]